MTAVRLETAPLFVRPDEDLSSFTPKFTRFQIQNMQMWKEESTTSPRLGSNVSYHFNLHLPDKETHSTGTVISISRSEANGFYGDKIALVNEYIKENPKSEATKWIIANMQELNAATAYWDAVNLLEKAELCRLKANLRALRKIFCRR